MADSILEKIKEDKMNRSGNSGSFDISQFRKLAKRAGEIIRESEKREHSDELYSLKK